MEDPTMAMLRHKVDMKNPDFARGYKEGMDDTGKALIAVLHSLGLESTTVSIEDLWFAANKKITINDAYEEHPVFGYEDDPDGEVRDD